jgi:nickel transport protein
MLRRLSLALAVAGTITPAAHAHGIWTAQRHGDLAVVYGHGAGDEAYRPEKVKGAVSYLASGERKDSTVVPQAKNALVEPAPDAVALTVVLDNGIWTKGPDGKSVNRPKSQVPEAQSASHSIKINTTILKSGAVPTKKTPDNAEVDQVSYFATLSFTLPHEED